MVGTEDKGLTVRCDTCGREMNLEVRVPKISAPGEFRDLFACTCGQFTPVNAPFFSISWPCIYKVERDTLGYRVFA